MGIEHVRPYERKDGKKVPSYARSTNRTKHHNLFDVPKPQPLHDVVKTLNDYDIIVQGNDLSYRNLEFVEFELTTLSDVDLTGSNLAETKWKGQTFSHPKLKPGPQHHVSVFWAYCTFTDANLRGLQHSGLAVNNCTFRNANFEKVDFEKITFTGANDFTGATLNAEQFSHIRTPSSILYEEIDFREAANSLHLSDARFEYLVLSGVIRVYDNHSKNLIHAGFDPDLHHVPDWEIRSAKRALE